MKICAKFHGDQTNKNAHFSVFVQDRNMPPTVTVWQKQKSMATVEEVRTYDTYILIFIYLLLSLYNTNNNENVQ